MERVRSLGRIVSIVRSCAMASFVSEKSTPRDTKIPSGYIPLIILHWLCEHYYGGSLTPLDMRKFLEEKLRCSFFTRDAVKTWMRNAECWEQQLEHHHPGSMNKLLQEYYQIRIAA